MGDVERDEVVFPSTRVLTKSEEFWDLIITETLEIQLDTDTFNHDIRIQLSLATIYYCLIAALVLIGWHWFDLND